LFETGEPVISGDSDTGFWIPDTGFLEFPDCAIVFIEQPGTSIQHHSAPGKAASNKE
jgi:hypothetical protein